MWSQLLIQRRAIRCVGQCYIMPKPFLMRFQASQHPMTNHYADMLVDHCFINLYCASGGLWCAAPHKLVRITFAMFIYIASPSAPRCWCVRRTLVTKRVSILSSAQGNWWCFQTTAQVTYGVRCTLSISGSKPPQYLHKKYFTKSSKTWKLH